MSTDLREIKRNAYMSFFQDGVWDIFSGVFILGWGLFLSKYPKISEEVPADGR